MKKIIKIGILLVAVMFISGCSLPYISFKHYSEDLANIFPDKVNTKASYFGLAEYAHSVTLQSIKKTRPLLTYYITGYVNDGISDDVKNRTFKVKYEVYNDKIKEIIDNNDEYREKGSDDTLNSIIPNQIILKLPLKVGTKWTQTFTYNKKEYKATTEIVKILDIAKNKKQYETRLVVNKISGFFNNQYIEKRVYETGRGLITFNNTMETTSVDGNAEDYMFGYTQGTIKYGK